MSKDPNDSPISQPLPAKGAAVALLWLLAALCLVSYAYLNIITLRGEHLADFSVYYKAVRNVASGETESIYALDSKMPFLYPPFFLVLLRPMAELDLSAATRVWLYLQSLFLAISVVTLLAVNREWDAVHAAFAVILFAAFSPVMLNNRYGQANSLYLALLSVFVLAYVRGAGRGTAEKPWDALAAGALSVAISIRVLPAALLVMVFIQRRYRVGALTAALVAVEVLAAGVVAGFSNEWHYFTSYMFHLRGLENMREISLLALAGRFLSAPADVAVFAVIVAAGIGIFLFKVLRPMRDAAPSLPLHPAFVISSMVLFAPLLEYHHYVILLAPYVLVIGDLRRRGPCCMKSTIPVFISWAIVSAANQLSYYRFGPIAFLALAGAALLWGYIIWMIASDGRAQSYPR